MGDELDRGALRRLESDRKRGLEAEHGLVAQQVLVLGVVDRDTIEGMDLQRFFARLELKHSCRCGNKVRGERRARRPAPRLQAAVNRARGPEEHVATAEGGGAT